MKPIRRQRVYAIVTIFIGVLLATVLILSGLKKNINLFYTPTQIQENQLEMEKLVRVGGMVKKGSLQKSNNSLIKTFEITDFNKTVLIIYEGILPDLFSEESGVVVQGVLNSKGEFIAQEVLAKHDENYMPPEVAKNLYSKE
ncbi:MAG: cytochrome c maturation protein CcmE [Gammaproteobacteria bacterium]|nr:cytochrome c maturation protein CcmE [Gammaproteobacteria bacterium]